MATCYDQSCEDEEISSCPFFLDVQDGSPTSHDRDHHGDKATQGKEGGGRAESCLFSWDCLCLSRSVSVSVLGGFAREMSAVF